MNIDSALGWLEAHPRTVDLVCIYFLMPLLAIGLRKLSTKLHIVAELLEATGLDAKKVVNLARGRIGMPPLPTMFMVIISAIVIGWTVSLAFVGCVPQQGAKSPGRDYARAGVMLVAEAVHSADVLCATIAETQHDAKLANTCADSYDMARKSLMGAQALVDAWDDADRGSYVCTMANAGVALARGLDAAKAAGARPPPLIDDALSFIAGFAAQCTGPS